MTYSPTKKTYTKPIVRARQKTMLEIEAVLKTALKAYKIDKDISRYRFVLHWEEIVGKQLAQVAKPDAIVGDVLQIKVQSSVWSQQISFYSKVIIKRVNALIDGEKPIKSLRFRI